MDPLIILGAIGFFLLTRSDSVQDDQPILSTPSSVSDLEKKELTSPTQDTAFLNNLVPNDVIDLTVASASFTAQSMPFPKYWMIGKDTVPAKVFLEKIEARRFARVRTPTGERPGTIFDQDPFRFRLSGNNFDQVKSLPQVQTGSVTIEIDNNKELQFFGSLYGNLCFDYLFASNDSSPENVLRMRKINLWYDFLTYNKFKLTRRYAREIAHSVDRYYFGETYCATVDQSDLRPGERGRMGVPQGSFYGNNKGSPYGISYGFSKHLDAGNPGCGEVSAETRFPDLGGKAPSELVVGGFSLVDAIQNHAIQENACMKFYSALFAVMTRNIRDTGNIVADLIKMIGSVFSFAIGAARIGLGDWKGGAGLILNSSIAGVTSTINTIGKTDLKYSELQTVFKTIEKSWNDQQKVLFNRGWSSQYLTSDFIANKFGLTKTPCMPWVLTDDPDQVPSIYDMNGFFPNYLALVHQSIRDWTGNNIIAPQLGTIIAQIDWQIPIMYTSVDNDLLTLVPRKRAGVVDCMDAVEIDESYLTKLAKGA